VCAIDTKDEICADIVLIVLYTALFFGTIKYDREEMTKIFFFAAVKARQGIIERPNQIARRIGHHIENGCNP
jgi:hypothetical protein